MTMTQTERRPLIARGSWQQELWGQLLAGRTIRSPHNTLAGRAASYSGKYASSFHNMLQRAEQRGYTVTRTPGSKGGEWSATYRLTGGPEE